MAAGMKTIISLAFILSIGLLMVILASALYNNWWPMLSFLGYVLALFPKLSCTGGHEGSDDLFTSDSSEGPLAELGYFLTTGFLVMGAGIPMIQSHANIITANAATLSAIGGALIYVTVISYAYFFNRSESSISL